MSTMAPIEKDRKESKLGDQLEEKLETIPDPVSELVSAVAKEAARRLDRDNGGRLAIIGAFVLYCVGGMVLSWLQGENIVTPELLIPAIGTAVLYVFFRLGLLAYNSVSLRLQGRAIELDIRELEVTKIEKEQEIYTLEARARIAREDLAFAGEQGRLDTKLTSDLQLRAPFFESSHTTMFELLTAEDAASNLQVPASLVAKADELDKILMRHTEESESVREVKNKLLSVIDDFDHRSKQNEKLMDTFMEQSATLTVKYGELDASVKNTNNVIDSLVNRINDLVVIFDSQMKKLRADIETAAATKPVILPPPRDYDGDHDYFKEGESGEESEEPEEPEGAGETLPDPPA